MDDLKQQFEKFQEQDVAKLAWFENLMQKHVQTLEELENVKSDLDTTRKGARVLNGNVSEAREQFEKLKRSVDRSSSILVLIDADADAYVASAVQYWVLKQFDEKYLVKGVAGGIEAVNDLQTQLRSYFETRAREQSGGSDKNHPDLAELPIAIKLYANVQKLKHALVRVGLHKASAGLEDFFRGFSQPSALVDFVDVGGGKEQVDHKIRGVLEHAKSNPSMKHILFGACHDNGYVRILRGIEHEEGMRDRLTLLKGFQTGAEYRSLGFQSTQIPSLFRSEVLDRGKHLIVNMSSNSTFQPLASSRGTFANIASSNPVCPPLTGSGDLPGMFDPGYIVVNAFDQRIDAILPTPTENARFLLRQRKYTNGKLMCNGFILQNCCPKTPKSCAFSHDKPSKAEIVVMRHELRRKPCKAGLECKNPTCFYGHNCRCVGDQCSEFPARLHRVVKTGMKKVDSSED